MRGFLRKQNVTGGRQGEIRVSWFNFEIFSQNLEKL